MVNLGCFWNSNELDSDHRCQTNPHKSLETAPKAPQIINSTQPQHPEPNPSNLFDNDRPPMNGWRRLAAMPHMRIAPAYTTISSNSLKNNILAGYLVCHYKDDVPNYKRLTTN